MHMQDQRMEPQPSDTEPAHARVFPVPPCAFAAPTVAASSWVLAWPPQRSSPCLMLGGLLRVLALERWGLAVGLSMRI